MARRNRVLRRICVDQWGGTTNNPSMNRWFALAMVAVFAGGVSAQAEKAEWKAARVWVSGGETGVWVTAASDTKRTALPLVQFWYAPSREGGPSLPRQQLALPPVSGNPIAVAADAGGLRILYSDLSTCDYFLKRPSSPGANWQAECRNSPLAWCGDATEPVLWALVETQALTPETTDQEDEGNSATTEPVEEIRERLAVLRLRDGIWKRRAGPRAADDGRRFWIAARAGDLHLFWEEAGQVRVADFHDERWSAPEVVLKVESVRHGWAGSVSDGPVFLAGRPGADDGVEIEAYVRREGRWSMASRLREGREFLSIDPRRAALGVAGGQVVVARTTGKGQVEVGGSDLEGIRPVRFEPLSLHREEPSAPSEWQDAIVLGLVLGMMTLVLWRRRDQVAAPIALPVGLVPAAVWRRGLATVLDFAPAVLLTLPWSLRALPEAATSGDLESVRQQLEDPEVMAKFEPVRYATILVYGMWCMIWEALVATTPGKFLFGCRVLSVAGGRPGPRQVFTRNVIRVIMVSMGAAGLIVTLMMIIMVTRNRQRLGDVWAGTIVVEPGLPAEETGKEERREGEGDDEGETP